jgi:hypothetical protein
MHPYRRNRIRCPSCSSYGWLMRMEAADAVQSRSCSPSGRNNRTWAVGVSGRIGWKRTAAVNHDRKICSCVVFIKMSMELAEPLRRDCKSTAYAIHFNCKMPSVYSGPMRTLNPAYDVLTEPWGVHRLRVFLGHRRFQTSPSPRFFKKR